MGSYNDYANLPKIDALEGIRAHFTAILVDMSPSVTQNKKGIFNGRVVTHMPMIRMIMLGDLGIPQVLNQIGQDKIIGAIEVGVEKLKKTHISKEFYDQYRGDHDHILVYNERGEKLNEAIDLDKDNIKLFEKNDLSADIAAILKLFATRPMITSTKAQKKEAVNSKTEVKNRESHVRTTLTARPRQSIETTKKFMRENLALKNLAQINKQERKAERKKEKAREEEKEIEREKIKNDLLNRDILDRQIKNDAITTTEKNKKIKY